MPPDRMPQQARTHARPQRLDRNIPHFQRAETRGVRDLTVHLEVGAFVALVVLVPILICAPTARPVTVTVLFAVLPSLRRSRVRYRHVYRF
ncbi:hypothetical protein AB0A70_29880 [Streptomyces morookaense]|uniref:hypothetical protein n=1 Tax=Streptomyces TaxID=1883 RepID=UPI001D0F7928|nr:hypothetical protein [Streptomyces sp. ET3-23]MCC2280486.1 hypothetical protein [Streptomyces sp. ET3-23]